MAAEPVDLRRAGPVTVEPMRRRHVRSVARIAAAGVAASALVGAAGWSLERSRLGASDEEGLARFRAELTDRFDTAGRAISARA